MIFGAFLFDRAREDLAKVGFVIDEGLRQIDLFLAVFVDAAEIHRDDRDVSFVFFLE